VRTSLASVRTAASPKWSSCVASKSGEPSASAASADAVLLSIAIFSSSSLEVVAEFSAFKSVPYLVKLGRWVAMIKAQDSVMQRRKEVWRGEWPFGGEVSNFMETLGFDLVTSVSSRPSIGRHTSCIWA